MHPAFSILQRPKLNWNWKIEPEQRLSIQVADYLRAATLDGSLIGVWHAVPNEGKRHQIVAAIMKAMGMLPGVGDIHVTGTWGSGYLELKVKPNKQSQTQKDFQAWCKLEEIHYAVCYEMDDVIDTLKSWGALAT